VGLLNGRRIDGAGVGYRSPARIVFFILRACGDQMHINPGFQHSLIQVLFPDCDSNFCAAAKAELN